MKRLTSIALWSTVMISPQIQLLLLLVLGFMAPGLARAQVTTGVPPFSSTSGGPDIVNEANLNVHLAIPILQKRGRGIPFSYVLNYDSSVWYPAGGAWNHSSTWGWRAGSEPLVGYIYYKITQGYCDFLGPHYWNVYDSFVYY